ncbi:MAG TPA: LPS export ABC transporter periplasmic protein LptC [Candidatus Omnitrophica bacterium]|nr:LPS export ABC transporter periplasmic protein LptC [Candidatus Omnitrophota bacterium]
MSKKVKIAILFIMFFCGTSLCAQAAISSGAPAPSEPQEMHDFSISGYGARGEKTWEVEGASMDMVGNDVNISDITAHLFGEKENMVLTADEGRFDRQSGVVRLTKNVRAVTDTGAKLATDSLDWSQKEQVVSTDEEVNITKENMTATAKGMLARPDFKVAKFEKDVKLTVDKKSDAKKGLPEPQAAKGQMTITCDGPMEMDYNKHYATFEKNVRVEGDEEQGTMIADKMTITFNPDSKQIERMDAEGHVRIIKGENVSESEGAVFTASDKKLVLTGRPKLTFYAEEGLDVSP